ncbi:MAG: NADAR family protein [Bacteroidota bacterium]
MKETDKYYLFWKHQFGQWTLRNMIDVDGKTYNCCEQYMMFKKAKLFKDHEIAKEILNEQSPANQQKLGRQINGFVPEIWDKNKIGIVWYGNYLKFSRHEDLKERLLATGNKIMAEASPYDLIWGIGFRANDELALDQSNWKGKNLLGKVLMSVREALKFTDKNYLTL